MAKTMTVAASIELRNALHLLPPKLRDISVDILAVANALTGIQVYAGNDGWTEKDQAGVMLTVVEMAMSRLHDVQDRLEKAQGKQEA